MSRIRAKGTTDSFIAEHAVGATLVPDFSIGVPTTPARGLGPLCLTQPQLLMKYTLWLHCAVALCILDRPSTTTSPTSMTAVQGARGTSCRLVSMPAPAPLHQALRHLNVLDRVEFVIPIGVSVRKGAFLSVSSNLNM